MKSVPTKKTHVLGAALFAAALALPSYQTAFAEATPEHGNVAFKYLNYKDSQPGQDRIGVNAYTTSIMMPFAGKWSVTSSYTYDSVSGASPVYHSTITQDMVSGASVISEKRNAGDISLTRYLEKGSWTFGVSYSGESDYISRGYSLQRSLLTDDKNTTLTFGGSYTTDSINAWKKSVFDTKEVFAGLFGITQILTKEDIVQLNVGYSNGVGYFSDPYKYADSRPRRRNITTFLTRWNHHFDGSDGTGKFSYRFYTDSYDVKAHTLSAEYVQPLHNEWTLIPSLRYSSQSAAYFYKPVNSVQEPPPILIGPYSVDQRLAALGALTYGIKVEKKLAHEWTVDLKLEQYEQTFNGDAGLAPFSYRSIQLGVSRVL